MRYCDAGGCQEHAKEIGSYTDHTGTKRTAGACGQEHKGALELALKLAGHETTWKPFEFKGETNEGV
jgi:hypothetical protein